jgi:hypothetical protein
VKRAAWLAAGCGEGPALGIRDINGIEMEREVESA